MQHSIQNAYIATILEAQHYIYIENQFFSNVSLTDIYRACELTPLLPIQSLQPR